MLILIMSFKYYLAQEKNGVFVKMPKDVPFKFSVYKSLKYSASQLSLLNEYTKT